MIISQTPFRISLFGGGTDYPDWYTEHGGSVLSTTIDKYCYISIRSLPPFFEYKHRIVYSRIETVNDFSEIQHPSVRECMKLLDASKGYNIHHEGDLPARSGTGSSSAFTVGMLKALHAANGQLISKFDLARQAIHVEQNLIKETVGSQDQIAAAYGGLNRIDFFQDHSFSVTPVIMTKERKQELEDNLMMFFTGFQRNAPEVAQKKIKNFKVREKELRSLAGMVEEALSLLSHPTTSLDGIGKLLDEAWRLKRSLAEGVSTPEIDAIYETAMKAGALGGKIMGAGGGGFMVFYVPQAAQAQVRLALKKLIHVSFRFENNGSRVVLYDPNF